MGFRHFAHNLHDLTFCEEKEAMPESIVRRCWSLGIKIECSLCSEEVNGPSYVCPPCAFIIHKSCFEMPIELYTSPLHPSTDHPLILQEVVSNGGFVCHCCRNLKVMYAYSCGKCEINLDVYCAHQTEGRSCDHQHQHQHHESKKKYNNLVIEVEHFLDQHKLALLYTDKERCKSCTLQLSYDEASYACLPCWFYLHKSCLEQIPQVKIQHPYHPHPLEASGELFGKCFACKTNKVSLRYVCSERSCSGFNIHMVCGDSCMDQNVPLRHSEDHHHELRCFVPTDSIGSKSICNKCDQLCEGASYMCFECDFNVHPKCILPPKVDHDCHFHPLTLRDSFREDDSGVYYCYACGEPRNGNYPVYFCEECPEDVPYVAHIECIISDEDDESSFGKTSCQIEDIEEPVKAEEGEQKGDLNTKIHEIERHADHHQLTFHATEGSEVMNCYKCETEIQGDKMYTCESCRVHFHPSCTVFPRDIRHPLHRHRLSAIFVTRKFMCGLCRKVSNKFHYECSTCNYALDAECAFLTEDQCQNFNEKHPEVKTKHLGHHHELTLAKCSSELGIPCEVCRSPISGSIYCCLVPPCKFFIHESCLEMKLEIQPSYHLPHRLSAQNLHYRNQSCSVCRSTISYIGYSCSECEFFLHPKCATDLTSSLKLEFHDHNLYSFAACDLWFGDHDRKSRFKCCKCSGTFSDSFYRCVECDLNIHLECIPLPKVVKHSCHVDPLTLVGSLREDDSGVYYCYSCGEPRNPNHPVYWCEECLFIAHVGCVIEEGDTSLEILLSKADINSDQQEPKSIEIII